MNLDVRGMEELELAGRRVLIRVDFNVPLDGGVIADDTRLQEDLQEHSPLVVTVDHAPGGPRRAAA